VSAYPVPTCDVPGCHGHLAKFDDCMSEAVWSWSMDGADRQTGSTEFAGHYSLVTLTDPDVFQMDEGQEDQYEVMVPHGHYVVFSAESGAVTVERFETAAEAGAVMDAAETAYGEWLGDDEDECAHSDINYRGNPETGADICNECGAEMAYPLLPGERPHAR
jgi:hypothetical protein